jgi:hypothetical protein
LERGYAYAARLSVFAHSTGASFAVTVYQGAASAFSVGGLVTSDPRSDVRRPLTDLAAQLARGAGPWLRVSGAPLDAAVRIDGALVGVLPYRGRVTPGEHVLAVDHPGRAAHSETLRIPDDAGFELHREVSLAVKTGQPASNATAPVAVERDRQLNWRRVTAAAVGLAAGVALTATGAYWLAQRDECPDEYSWDVNGEQQCAKQWSAGPKTISYLAIGVPLLLVGGTWLGFELMPAFRRDETRAAVFELGVKGAF